MMGDVIGRCLSRQASLTVLTEAEQYVPEKRKNAYSAALNRVRYEFIRHEPVEPNKGHCGACGALLTDGWYCTNCGREVKKE